MHQHPGSSAVRGAAGRGLSKVGAGREALVAGSVVGSRQAVHGYLLFCSRYLGITSSLGRDRMGSDVDGVWSMMVVMESEEVESPNRSGNLVLRQQDYLILELEPTILWLGMWPAPAEIASSGPTGGAVSSGPPWSPACNKTRKTIHFLSPVMSTLILL